MSDLDTTSWYALGIPLYALFVLVEVVMDRRRVRAGSESIFTFPETISNLTSGLGTLIVGLFVGPFILGGWNFIRDHVSPCPWPAHGLWKFPLALVLADFLYFAYHRAGHKHAIFWAIHGIHHQHERLNSSVGFRLEWLADPYAALFYSLMPLAGVDPATGFLAIMVLSMYTLTAHSPTMPRPTWGFLITPAIHGTHHSRDTRFAEKNYGAMLGIWDRLFGSWAEPAPGTVLREDVPSISRTHDGVSTQWSLFIELGRRLRATPGPWAKLRLLYAPPTLEPQPRPLREGRLSRPLRVYILIQFLALVALAGWLLWFRGERPLPVQLVCAATIVAGLATLGGLLDGRPRAAEHERMRLVGTVLAGAAMGFYAPVVGVAVVVLALGGLVPGLVPAVFET